MTIIRDTKLSGLRGFIDRLRNFNKYKVYVGVPSTTNRPHEGGINMAGLLAVHEFGVPKKNIPERSTLRAAIIENRQELTNIIAQGTRVYNEQNKKLDLVFYDKIGLFASNLVKDKFVKGPFVPLKPTTIKRKGSTKPLIDTGALRQSITWVARK